MAGVAGAHDAPADGIAAGARSVTAGALPVRVLAGSLLGGEHSGLFGVDLPQQLLPFAELGFGRSTERDRTVFDG
ncbi:hypothetical protein DF186_21320, partial [Enterococcus hirae]